MSRAPRPQWQQATALITIGAGTAATGLTFVPRAAADLTSPASVPPVTLLALEHASAPAPGRDAVLRAAIVHIARHFLRLADTRSPAEMEAMIWQYASMDGANHGPSCAAFASLTLELGSHIAGLDSWVTGGTSYPWPVHAWVDGRVDPNPASPGVVSVLQDAQAHGRWHPLGDGYLPQPGDWVLFNGHVEVVTSYQGGVLHTIGGDSLPNMSVNAHEYSGPMQQQGVAGFVDNGVGMSTAASGAPHRGGGGKHGEGAPAIPGSQAPVAPTSAGNLSRSAGLGQPARPASHRGSAGRSASGGSASGGSASGGPPSAGSASSAGPANAAGAGGQQAELAPRAIPAPPTVPRSRFAQASRALPAQGARTAPRGEHVPGAGPGARPAQATRTTAGPQRPSGQQPTDKAAAGTARVAQPAGQRPEHSNRGPLRADRRRATTADVPATGLHPARPHHARQGGAAIPGLFKAAHQHHAHDVGALAPYHRHDVPPSNAPAPGTTAQQAFINEVAQGAMLTQDRYGVPASVTIAQAIDESGWGQSLLATSDHNLFGIKGTGPAGSDVQPTQEVINGQLVNLSASFQIYENVAQSIDAHGRLLANSGDYAGAMSQTRDPNAFAAALTGVYATDPTYGAKLVQLMQQYDLYRFDQAAARGAALATHHGAPPARPAGGPGAKQQAGKRHPARAPLPQTSPGPRKTAPGHDHRPSPKQPGPVGNPVPVQPAPIAEPGPGQPAPIAHPAPAQPGPLVPVHDAKPAGSAITGASARAVRQAGTPPAAPPADHVQTVHHDAATPPAAVLYPGRSARPAPLAHPQRPAGPASQSGPTPGVAPGAAATQAKHAHVPAEAASAARQAGSAMIPGLQQHDHGAQPGAGPSQGAAVAANAPTRGAAQPGGSSVPGDQRRAAAGAGPHTSAGPAAAPAHPATATVPAGSSAIPGTLPAAAGPAPRPSAGPAAAPSHAPATTLRSGGSDIPGARQPAGSASRLPASSATASSHAPSSPSRLPAAPTGGPPRPAGRAGTLPARGNAAPAPGNQPSAAHHASARPGGAATTAGRAATAPAGHAAAPGHAAGRAGASRPSTAQTRGPAGPRPASATPAPVSAQAPPAAANPVPTAVSTPPPGGAAIPGLAHGAPAAARSAPAGGTGSFNGGSNVTTGVAGGSSRAPGGSPAGSAPSASGGVTLTAYHAHMPPSVREAFVKSAKTPLVRSEHLYRDVASHTGIRWELLAACDWMQCKARHGYSPVYGEKLGALNPDDTCYRTKSAALEQCASDLVQLARSVYQLDIATSRELSVRDLANVFAAFRWGGLLRQHCTSAMDFPYSVAGLTADHTHMRWPNIDEPNAPDKPGSRFRQTFGAVPVVLGLNYQALM